MIKVDKNPEFIIRETMDGFSVLVSGVEVKRKWFRKTKKRGHFFLSSDGRVRFTFYSSMPDFLIEKCIPFKFMTEGRANIFVKKIKRVGLYD